MPILRKDYWFFRSFFSRHSSAYFYVWKNFLENMAQWVIQSENIFLKELCDWFPVGDFSFFHKTRCFQNSSIRILFIGSLLYFCFVCYYKYFCPSIRRYVLSFLRLETIVIIQSSLLRAIARRDSIVITLNFLCF